MFTQFLALWFSQIFPLSRPGDSGLVGLGLFNSLHFPWKVKHVLWCRGDVRLYQEWYCNQFWGYGSDAVLPPSPEPAESIPPADMLVGRWTLWFVHWPLLGSKCEFQELVPPYFSMNYRHCCLQHYRFHSLCGLSLWYTFCRFLVLGKSHNLAIKFQDLNFTLKFDVFWKSTKGSLNASELTDVDGK